MVRNFAPAFRTGAAGGFTQVIAAVQAKAEAPAAELVRESAQAQSKREHRQRKQSPVGNADQSKAMRAVTFAHPKA